MTADSAAVRSTVHYSGRVQGVGFRYTARAIAGGHNVTGYVQNLDDGRVRVIVEGERDEIDRFLAEVADRMSGYIRDMQVHKSSATGEFDGFGIEH
ncbi:MAG TPA: acylphosphatase [Pirellulales bacterium]|nr:acylphosphatase [Pirellulales bacterium]